MPIVRRSRRLSDQTIPDPLDQCVPGGFDYLDIPNPAAEPLVGYPAATAKNPDPPLSPQTIEYLCAFVDKRELAPPDLHSQCRRRKGKNGNAPRPPNAFMLFRSDFWRFNKETIPERDHRQISRIAARCWNVLEEPKRIPYQEQARKLKDEHAQLYPHHKYNLSAKDRAPKKVKKEDIDNDERCGVIAAQFAQGVKVSRSLGTSGAIEGGLLDKIVEQKVSLKRPRSASSVAVAERASQGESRPSQPPVKKRKRNPRKISIAVIPVLVVQSQVGSSHSSSPQFVPTNNIPVLTLPPSRNPLAVKAEVPQDSALEVPTPIFAVEKEPTLSPAPVATPPKMDSPELEVPELPVPVWPQAISFGHDTPVEYLPVSADAVVDRGLEISKEYGLSELSEGLDFSIFDHLGDAPAMGLMNEHGESVEFAQWCGLGSL